MDNDKLVAGIFGFGVGFAACYLLVKSGTIAMSLESTETQRKHGFMSPQEKLENNPLADWRPLQNLPSVDRLDEFKPIPLSGEVVQELQQHEPQAVHYKNNEKIKVIRDSTTNRILGYDTDRDAKIG
jgi:hypothetical protein